MSVIFFLFFSQSQGVLFFFLATTIIHSFFLSFFPYFLPSFLITLAVPRVFSNFPPIFWSSLKILTSFPLLLLVSQISASVTPTQRTADVRSSCVRERLYPSESVSGGIHFTHVLLQFRLSLIHIHQCNSAFPEIWKVWCILSKFIKLSYVPLCVMKWYRGGSGNPHKLHFLPQVWFSKSYNNSRFSVFSYIVKLS